MKWLVKPVSMPLWWHLCAAYVIGNAIWRSEITQGFIHGLTGAP